MGRAARSACGDKWHDSLVLALNSLVLALKSVVRLMIQILPPEGLPCCEP